MRSGSAWRWTAGRSGPRLRVPPPARWVRRSWADAASPPQVGVLGQLDGVAAQLGQGALGPLGAGGHLRDPGPDEGAPVAEGVAERAGGEVGAVPAAGVAFEAEVAERGGDDGRVPVEAGEERAVGVAEALRQVRLGPFGAFDGGHLGVDQGLHVGGARQRARVDVPLGRAGLARGGLLREEDDEVGGLGAGDRRGGGQVRPDGHPGQFGVPVAGVRRGLVRLAAAEPLGDLGDAAGGGLLAPGGQRQVGGRAAAPDRLRRPRRHRRVGGGEGGEAGRERGAQVGGRGGAGGGDEHPVAAGEQPREQVGDGLRRTLGDVHDLRFPGR
ncbi:hypothetical protein LUW74_27345 [Actinomadura madurae]|uniref:hypothetical protein n=1 Tax=Actinomadura madurae TaxID=1993 RepID=UPI0020264430|nr:hypothetical protein [Actinomadura madurae]URN06663.1 hypothetical protein LUW74_27345 [Actinomadura madurae]